MNNADNLTKLILVLLVAALGIACWEGDWLKRLPWRKRYAWLCDDCGERAALGRPVCVGRCEKCSEDKCPHCFPIEESFICDKCQISGPRAGTGKT